MIDGDRQDPIHLAAAAVGHFDPLVFGRELVESNEAYERAMAALAERCTEVLVGDQYHWTMRPETRITALGALAASPQRDELVAAARDQLADDDRLGRYLVNGLEGESLEVHLQRSKHDPELLKAARFLQDGGVVPDEAAIDDLEREVRRAINAREARETVEVVRPTVMVGRDGVYDQLLAYLKAELPPERLSVFVLTGVGGIGKSALVSEFVARQRRREGGPPVVYLDFDRATLAAANPLALTLELARQLGLFDPSINEAVETYRQRNRLGTTRDFESGSSYAYGALSELRHVLDRWPHVDGRVTLVLDTFEEVALRGDAAPRQVLLWLNNLRDVAGLRHLRVVLTGRVVAEGLLAEEGVSIGTWARHDLQDLDVADSTDVLVRLGVAPDWAERAALVFGGNPLVLRLFHRFAEQRPGEVEALLAEAEEVREAEGDDFVPRPYGELAVRFLHDRIVSRIEPELESLASPGLLLRRVTVDLIEEVLAPHGALDLDAPGRSRELFEALAGHVWLVERGERGELVHQREVRRLILPGVVRESGRQATEIHRSAVAYYESDRSDLPPLQAGHEADYHRGMLGEPPTASTAAEAAALISALGADIGDWPPGPRAKLLAAAQSHELLSEEERATLSGADLDRARREAVRLTLQHGDVTGARAVAERVPVDDGRFDQPSLALDFAEGHFERVVARGEEALAWYFGQGATEAKQVFWVSPNLFEHSPWLVTVAHLAVGPTSGRALTERVLETLRTHDQPRRRWRRNYATLFALGLASILGERAAVNELAVLLDGERVIDHPTVRHNAQLHLLQASLATERGTAALGAFAIERLASAAMLRDTARPLVLERFRLTDDERALLAAGSPALQGPPGDGTVVDDPPGDGPPSDARLGRPILWELNHDRRLLDAVPVVLGSLPQVAGLPSPLRQLHRPIRVALAALPDPTVLDLLDELTTIHPGWPTEFTPDAVAARGERRTDETLLASVIETADWLGLLTNLLAAADRRVTGDTAVRRLLQATDRLEQALGFDRPEA